MVIIGLIVGAATGYMLFHKYTDTEGCIGTAVFFGAFGGYLIDAITSL